MSVSYDLKPENTKIILHNLNPGVLKGGEYICYQIQGRTKRRYCLIISSEEGFRNRIMHVISQRLMRRYAPEDSIGVNFSLHWERALELCNLTFLEVSKLTVPEVQSLLGQVKELLEKEVKVLQGVEREKLEKVQKKEKINSVMIFNGVIHSQNPEIPFGGMKVYKDYLKKRKK